MPQLGAHQSVAGGLYLAFERIKKVDGDALQIFTRNQRQWNPPPLKEQEIELFREAWEKTPGMAVNSHASYLVNLATDKEELLQKSVNNLAAELQRCARLDIPQVVLHPGSHGGSGVEAGLNRFVKGLDQALEKANTATMVLVETTAGQGTGLGADFRELGFILSHSKYPELLGVCVDSCHIFAAGYELRTSKGYQDTMRALEESIGFAQIQLLHLNDSKKELGSRVDRHDHIGKGHIGLEGFRNLMQDDRLAHLAMTLETPKGEKLLEDMENLATLRQLCSESS